MSPRRRSRGRGGGRGLRRELGPLSATLFTAGMMVGIGIFATFGAATEAAGSGILVATLLGGSIAVMFVGTEVVTLGVLGADQVGGLDTPMLAAAQQAIGGWGTWVVLAAAILAAWGTLAVLTAGRFVFRRATSGRRSG